MDFVRFYTISASAGLGLDLASRVTSRAAPCMTAWESDIEVPKLGQTLASEEPINDWGFFEIDTAVGCDFDRSAYHHRIRERNFGFKLFISETRSKECIKGPSSRMTN